MRVMPVQVGEMGVLDIEGKGVSVGTAGSVAVSDQRVSEMSHLKHAGF